MIAQTQTTSFKLELYEGIHNLLTDNIYIALYDANAVLDSTTTVYTTTHEMPCPSMITRNLQGSSVEHVHD